MYLTVGEISKALGVTSEMIRFYVREGIIKPRKNEENNYWEYSTLDVLYITDILFYRNMDLPLSTIKKIFDGLEVELIGDIIRDHKKLALENFDKYKKIYRFLLEWEEAYNEEMNLLGKFKVCHMPPELRVREFYNEKVNIIDYFKNGIRIHRDDWSDVSLSFYCNICEPQIEMKRYLSVNKTDKTELNNKDLQIAEESADRCLCTQVFYSDDIMEMIKPLLNYAEANGYILKGEVFGRENTNYYSAGNRYGLYRVYAPLL